MPVEENKQIVQEFIEASNRGDFDAAAAMFAEYSVNHGMRVGRDQMRMVLEDLGKTFGNPQSEIHTVIADDDWVVLRTTMSGKHSGKNAIPIHMLTPGTEPTGKPFKVQIIHMLRIADGKIVEHWVGRDDLGLHYQLGLIPAPDWYKARLG